MTQTGVLLGGLPDAHRITGVLMRLALVVAAAGMMGFCSSSDGDYSGADTAGGTHSGAGQESSGGDGGGGDGGSSD